MSNSLAIATTTVALGDVIQGGIKTVSGAKVTTVRPDEKENGEPAPEANVFLYQIAPSVAHRNADLPTRSADGELRQRPQLGLELHYLVSFYGDQVRLEPQRLLGGAISALHARPRVTAPAIQAIIDASAAAGLADPRHYLGETDLAEQVEYVNFTPMLLNLEEFSRLWSTLFRVPYVLSVAYRASVVLVEAVLTPKPAPPVRSRALLVLAMRRPSVERVEAATGADDPIVAGSTLVLRGRNLRGEETRVRVGDAVAAPDAAALSDAEIRIALSAPPFSVGALRAGVQGVQILHRLQLGVPPTPHDGAESNVVALVLRPALTSIAIADVEGTGDEPRSALVTVQAAPAVGGTQRVALLLDAVGGDEAYTFYAMPRDADGDPLAIPIVGVAAGTYLVRIQIDGSESLLDDDLAGPTVTVP